MNVALLYQARGARKTRVAPAGPLVTVSVPAFLPSPPSRPGSVTVWSP